MKVVFLGTPDIAVPSLSAVHKKHDVTLVVTQPDRPRGRGRHLGVPPVKTCALEFGLPCRQPAKLDTGRALAELKSAGADIIVVVAFGMRLPDSVLNLTRYGAVNLHFSLLPAYRGAAPINWAIIGGEKETGATTFRITSRMDGGPVYLRRAVAIGERETAGELGTRLATIGAEILVDTVEGIAAGALSASPQAEEGASRAPKLKKEDGRIDWSRPAGSIVNLIRGVNPWPGAYTLADGQTMKVWRAVVSGYEPAGNTAPGTILIASASRGLLVAAGEGTVALTEIQAEGKRRMPSGDFLLGHPLTEGSVFT